MADIEQVRSEVSRGCDGYKEDLRKMEFAQDMMNKYQAEANQAKREMDNAQAEINSLDYEISSLQREVSQSTDDDGSSSSYAIQRLNLLYQKQQALSMKVEQSRSVYLQAEANYAQAQSQYAQAESDLNRLRNYLEQVRTQMIQAADVFQTKIDGFNQSLDILGGASGNMFASSANEQMSHLQVSRNQYQQNLYLAQDVIEQIGNTIDDQGSAKVLTLSSGHRRSSMEFENHFEHEMTNQPNRSGEFAPSMPSYNSDGWEALMNDPPPFAGGSRSR